MSYILAVILAAICIFMPNSFLTKPEITAFIGTKNPVVARVACILAVIMFLAILIFRDMVNSGKL